MFADLLQAPVVMVSDVPVGLTELLGDLFERMPFEEMQSERLPLVFGKRLQDLPPAVSTEETFHRTVVLCSFSATKLVTFDRLVLNSRCIEAASFQFSSAEERLGVSNLKYP